MKEMSKEISHMAYLGMVVSLAGLLAIFKKSLELAWFSFIISQYATYEHQFFIEFVLWLFLSSPILASLFIQEFQLDVAKAWSTTPGYW